VSLNEIRPVSMIIASTLYSASTQLQTFKNAVDLSTLNMEAVRSPETLR
jgi:hypothetical protein